MTSSPTISQSDVSFPASIPSSTVSLESVLCTEQLRLRPLRPPDYVTENRALVTLSGALADSQPNILQALAETILDVTKCDSSGVSLLTKHDGGKRFYWPAIAGAWKPHIGGGTPRDFGPCGDVLDRNQTLLFRHFERRYTYFLPVVPLVEECLLVPFYVAGKAVGTIWAIMHSARRKFDVEDERIMSNLGQFASLAYQTLETIDDLKQQIAARERAEAKSRELAAGLQAKIHRLVDANIMGIFIWHADGQIVEANDAFLQLVGYDRGDLVSGRLKWKELTPAEWSDADRKRIAELETIGVAQPHEKEYFHRSGERVPVLVGGATFEGTPDEGVAFVIDLTERKRAEEAVRRSEKELRDLLENMPAMAFTSLPDGSQPYCTNQWQEYFGLSAAEANAGRWQTMIHPEDARPFLQKRQAALGTEKLFECEARFRHVNGEYRWFLVRVTPLRDERGNIVKRYGVLTDISERKRAEVEAQEAQKALAHANRVATVGQLSSSIAHEVSQPIGAVLANAHAGLRWLAAEPSNLEEVRQALDRIITNGNRAGDVIERIRAFVKKVPPRKDRLNINEAILDVIGMTTGEAAKNCTVIRTQLAQGLPDIRGDRIQLQQVILNLIINAVEAMAGGGEDPRELLITTAKDASDGIRIAVQDSGPGLAPLALDRIFEAFYTTKPSGLGMGLSISRSIVEAHDGRLWADAGKPRGAVFTFTLPAQQDAVA